MHNYKIGDDIGLEIGGALGMTCVVVELLHGTVTAVSNKAIRIRADGDPKADRGVWIPRKAITVRPMISDPNECSFELARWFRPRDFSAWYLNQFSTVSGQSYA